MALPPSCSDQATENPADNDHRRRTTPRESMPVHVGWRTVKIASNARTKPRISSMALRSRNRVLSWSAVTIAWWPDQSRPARNSGAPSRQFPAVPVLPQETTVPSARRLQEGPWCHPHRPSSPSWSELPAPMPMTSTWTGRADQGPPNRPLSACPPPRLPVP